MKRRSVQPTGRSVDCSQREHVPWGPATIPSPGGKSSHLLRRQQRQRESQDAFSGCDARFVSALSYAVQLPELKDDSSRRAHFNLPSSPQQGWFCLHPIAARASKESDKAIAWCSSARLQTPWPNENTTSTPRVSGKLTLTRGELFNLHTSLSPLNKDRGRECHKHQLGNELRHGE